MIKSSESNNPVRVAIYTRTSSAERLHKEENSLKVQYKYCVETAKRDIPGCVIIDKRYDDGGYSGKDGDRPAYEELKCDIIAGLIDVVMVYMLDRIGRNMREFTSFYEFFENHNIKFKSASEHFDSTTDEGELMMNNLMSFAQYFLKSTIRRIRDSVASAKARGLWTLGRPILGYDLHPKTRKLVINSREAEWIRFMFKRFLETGKAKLVAKEMNDRGYSTKEWLPKPRSDGTQPKKREAKPITYWMVLRWLVNPTYAGLIYHKRLDAIYQGQHDAIIDRQLFDKVQKILAVDRNKRQGQNRSRSTGLLKGILHCGCCGSVMRPTYATANKGKYGKNKQYPYYLCAKAAKFGYDKCEIKTIPAKELERVVVEHLMTLFQAPEVYAPTVRAAHRIRQQAIEELERKQRKLQISLTTTVGTSNETSHCTKGDPDDVEKQLLEVEEQLREVRATYFEEQDVVNALKEFSGIWDTLQPGEQQRVVQLMLEKVVVYRDGLDLHIRQNGLQSITKDLIAGQSDLLKVNGDRDLAPELRDISDIILLHIPVELKRVNGKRRMRTAKDSLPEPEPWPQHDALVLGLAKGHAWANLLKGGDCKSLEQVAKLAGVGASYVGRMLKLTLLAPDIQEQILNAKEPENLSLAFLRKGFPLEWAAQRKALGFPDIDPQLA